MHGSIWPVNISSEHKLSVIASISPQEISAISKSGTIMPLKGLRLEDIVVLAQFCAEVIC